MAIRLGDAVHQLEALRIEPTAKRIRARLGGDTVVDSSRAALVWEPRRVTPVYAVPRADIDAVVVDAATRELDSAAHPPVWDPRVPFAVRLTPGHPVVVTAPGGATAEGFIADDQDLDGFVILDFAGFDWLEDDERIVSHPHDPFSRIDVRDSGAEYSLTLDGELLARTTHARILYETALPPRLYWPRDDVLVPLTPSTTRSSCAYKGAAEYYSATVAGRELADVAWSYPDPLVDGERVRGRIAFFEERLDLDVDGVRREQRYSPFA